MNINQLPDLCLAIIFEHVPLSMQLRCLQVCKHWTPILVHLFRVRKRLSIASFERRSILGHYLPRRTAFNQAKQDLLLKGSEDGPTRAALYANPYDSPDCVYVSPHHFTNNTFINHLCTMFPNIVWLDLILNHVDSCIVPNLCVLLLRLEPALQQLSLHARFNIIYQSIDEPFADWGPYCPTRIHANCLTLLQVINSCRRLRSLTIGLDHLLFDPSHRTVLDLSIIKQLEVFRFFSQDDTDVLMAHTLQKYDRQCVNLKRFELLNRTHSYQMSAYLALAPEFRQTMSHYVPLGLEHNDLNSLQAFTNLTTLNLAFFRCCGSFRDLIFLLTPLKQLIFVMLNHWYDYSEEEVEEQVEWPQMPSVRFLRLQIEMNSHLDFVSIYQPEHCFPRLQVFKLKYDNYRCDHCRYDFDDDFEERIPLDLRINGQLESASRCVDLLLDWLGYNLAPKLQYCSISSVHPMVKHALTPE